MTTFAILPIKTLDRAKQRLAEELEPTPRRALVEAMFSDSLVALRRCGAVEQVIVVTADHVAQRIAAGYGASVLPDTDSGHNDAARRGVEEAVRRGADRVLLVPGDCPMLDPGELDALLARSVPAPSLLVVPDRHGAGTNALLITPPDAIASSFGEGSHARHLAQAQAAGIHAETVEVASLAMDVDTPEDLAAIEEHLRSSRGGAAHTRGMLRQLVRSRG